MTFADWVRIERADRQGRAAIGARRIYILPTRYGLIFAVLLFLMLLGAVNYGNNPAHLLTFLLAGIGGNTIYLTWRNLRGLTLRCEGASPVFAGDTAKFIVRLNGEGRERPAVQLMFDKGEPCIVDIPTDTAVDMQLPLAGLNRGQHQPPRLVLSTRYPLGLFRAWCYVICEKPILVYPRAGKTWTRPGDTGEHTVGGERGTGNEDFAGLRAYQPGDQPARIDWKSYARERDLNTRLFSGEAQAPLWIDWDHAPGENTETRLSALTRAIVDAENDGLIYGLRTPTMTIDPGSGPRQQHQCLRHLALYGQGDD